AHEHQRGAVTGAPEASAHPEPSARAERRRWIALAVLCLGQLMMVLDATIVNVALPAIQRELHFTQQNLTWVMNGYLITFGGFLLLAGRMGDLVGRKKVFLAGLVLFTVASMMCGVAGDQTMLIVARLLQGIGGAVASSVILAIIVTEFPGASEQARAMGLFAFVSAGGGSIGLLAGGALTQSLDWHCIFFVNVPIGSLAFVLVTVCIGGLSMGVSAKAMARYGPLRLLTAGLASIVAGLLLLAQQGDGAGYFPGLFFAFLLLGLGAGSSFLPLLTVGMADAPPRDAGLASGIVNVSIQLFGAIGLRRLAPSPTP